MSAKIQRIITDECYIMLFDVFMGRLPTTHVNGEKICHLQWADLQMSMLNLDIHVL
jgi:hypothetical protein